MRWSNPAANLIPRFWESIPAGFPSAAEGYEDEPLNLQEWIVHNPAATFFYRVRGEATRHEHIRDGSVLVVDRSLTPSPGKLVLIEDPQAGEFAIARFRPGLPQVICGVVTAIVTKI